MGNRKKISAKAATYTAEETEAYLAKKAQLAKTKKANREVTQARLRDQEVARRLDETIRLQKASEAKAKRIEEQKAFEATQSRYGSKRTKAGDTTVKPGEAGRVAHVKKVKGIRQKNIDNPKAVSVAGKPEKTRREVRRVMRTRARLALAA